MLVAVAFLLVAAPSPLGAMKIPDDNPQAPEKIALGEQLWFDKRLSVDGTRACYSCHQNEDGLGGHDPLAIGPGEKKLTRHSPVMWNVGFLPRWYWDGRATTLEGQTKAAWGGGNMGVGNDNLEAKAKTIEAIEGYKAQFAKVFPDGVTAANVVKALVAYERTLVCDNTAYDRFVAGEKEALSKQAQRGLALFTGKAGCTGCHPAPFFSAAYEAPEGMYYNAGVGTEVTPEDKVDVGRMSVTKKESDWAAFKVPSLRNVGKSAPYFHDGSVTKLEDAVRFMAAGGRKNKNLSELLVDKKLSAAEVKDLVAFLKSLDCPGVLKAPKLP